MGLRDDVIYASLLILSIIISAVLRRMKTLHKISVQQSEWISTACGITMVLLVAGLHSVHTFVSLISEWLLLRINAPAVVSFVAQFAYLFYVRLGLAEQHFGLGSPFPPHANAIQMMLALKMISVAFELQDASSRLAEIKKDDKETSNADLNAEIWHKEAYNYTNFVQLFHYTFTHVGVLTGPHFKLSTWKDTDRFAFYRHASCDEKLLVRFIRVPLYVVLFLVTNHFFGLNMVDSTEFYDQSSLPFRVVYMFIVFFAFRMRIYSGFVLSECACIAAGLGLYPKEAKARSGAGPTNPQGLKQVVERSNMAKVEFDFETVHNIDEMAVESVCSMRLALRTWNMTVQHFLVANIYRRFPIKALRTTAVMIASAMWHGVHPGYYLSLGSVPLVLVVEDFWNAFLRKKLSVQAQEVYDKFNWLFRMLAFSYLGMGFQLLRIDATMTYWHSVFYIGHLMLPLLYILGLAVNASGILKRFGIKDQ